MKRKLHFARLSLMAAILLAMASCQPVKNNPNIPDETEGWAPIYATEQQAYSIVSEQPRSIEKAGKIYIQGNYLFQVETGKGIHVTHIGHHHNPQKVQFIAVTGAQEVAIKGNSLYTNNLNDLVVIDISNLADVKLINRIPGVFHVLNQQVPSEGGYFECVDASKGTVIGWEKKILKKPECSSYNYSNGSKDVLNSTAANDVSGGGFESPAGRGGSLARFTIAQNHLYIVDDYKLYAYSLANSIAPQLSGTAHVGTDIETIYSYKDKLFIGSRNAMFIYSISSPGTPVLLGTATHVRACDPVVANDSIAYVTVRNGSNCGGSLSALLVYDVTNVLSPAQVTQVNMESPYGLGAIRNRLYVCNGENGLNVFDITKGKQPKIVKKINEDVYYDVIAMDNLLICLVKDGMVLYDYSTTDELVRMAKISN